MKSEKEYQELVQKFNQSVKKGDTIQYQVKEGDKMITDTVIAPAFMLPTKKGVFNFKNAKSLDADIFFYSVKKEQKANSEPPPPTEKIEQKIEQKIDTKIEPEKEDAKELKEEPKPEKRKPNEIVQITADKIAAFTGFSTEEIAVIKQTVAKNVTNTELSYFLSVAKHVGLSPFNKEIWCYKDNKGNLIVFAGRDGMLRKAQENPEWGGIRSCEVCANDEYEADIPGGVIYHKISGFDRGAILGAYAIVWRKNCEPTIEIADMKVFARENSIWKTQPRDMIKKVAEIHALKKAFGFAAVQCEEDFNIEGNTAFTKGVKILSPEQVEAIDLLNQIPEINESFKNATLKDINNASPEKIQKIINLLRSKI